ncbi:MAG: transporter [Cyanobacteria bacterium J06623_4]
MTSQELLLLLFSVVTAACGQLLLKLGAVKINLLEASTLLGKVWEAVTIPELIIGLTFYGLSAVSYILLLTRVKLSVAAPGTASIYILSVLIGIVVLKEPVVPARLLGLALIACGVVLVVSK